MKRFLAVLLSCLLFFGSVYSAENVIKTNKKLPFSKGVNLPGWLEYNRNNTLLFGKKDFENIKSLGVEVLRLPVWFEVWNEGAPDYKVSDECWSYLDDSISWCEELGMYIIIDFHNDCDGASKTDPNIEKVLLKVWPQIANRYKNKGDLVIYEVMNEPHFKSGNIDADIKKWGAIQGNVLKAIRQIDKKHTVIVGGADWNSIDSMLKLPEYQDDNLIYNFHDYSPFLFTHQGAVWTDAKRLTGIPFPYVKEKMPALPKNPTSSEKWYFQDYPNASSEKTLVAPLNKAAEFANKRNAALMCNEFGVSMTYADPQERNNWYRIKNGWMDERNIIRVSWDYTGSFGIFTNSSEARFPEDLNKQLIKDMGYKVPAGKSQTWFEAANKTGNYTIFQNQLAANLKAQCYGSNQKKSIVQFDNETKERSLAFSELEPNGQFTIYFGEVCNFTALKNSGARLEFMIKSTDKTLSLSVYLIDSEAKTFPWRAATSINSGNLAIDGKWHKISIPLSSLSDIGGWNSTEGWVNGQGKFDWNLISSLVFQNGGQASKAGFSIKDIKIVK